MYIDLEGSDDDIFSGANDKGSKGREKDDNNHEYTQARENTRDYEEFCEKAEDLNEDDYEEFCEKAANEDELHSLHSASEDDGLVESFKEVGLGVEHRHCMKHLYDNYKVHFRGIEYKKGLWAVASAGSMAQFEYRVAKLKEFDTNAYDWVMRSEPKTWARAFFSTHVKYQALQNNICESFDAYILKVRDIPILSMFEWIRRRIMKRFHVKYTAMLKYKGDICPNAQDTLEKLKFESRNCFCTPAGSSLKSMYISTFIRIPIWLYNYVLHPLPGQHDWKKTNLPDIQPAMVRKPAGRPKKRRIRAIDEPRNPFKLTRVGGTVYCGNCKQKGHNVRGFKAVLTGDTPWQRRQRLSRAKKMVSNVI
ncbi:hypothetical protein GH714_027083 [Hevea brasiliensis]|uniref:Transposase MuDR plant domain-containing protein n=1 Tax=Hevea brasiliensis TaxID=3981 RepID=A0A6A6L5J5_HEVBR|nr:hypothetical protein GH714_027083 [Hevea brasiliensis]